MKPAASASRLPPNFEPLESRLLLSTVPEGMIDSLWTDVTNSPFAPTLIGYALGEHGSTFGQASSLMAGAIGSILDSLPGSFDASADVTFSVGIEAEASLGLPGVSRQLASLGTGYNLTYSFMDENWTLSRYLEFSLLGVDVSTEYFASFDSILSISSTDWVTFGVSAAVGAGTDDAIQVGQLLRAGIEAGLSGDISITAETNLRVDDFLSNYVQQPSFAEGLADVFIPYYGDTWWENLLTGVASFVPILPLEQLLNLTRTDTPLGILAHSGSVDVSISAGFDVNAGGWFGLGGEVPVAPGLNVGGQIFVGVSLSEGAGIELWSQSYSGWQPVEPDLVLPDPLSCTYSAIPSTDMAVTFNKDLDMSSVSGSSVHITGSRSGSHGASFDAPSNVLTINPTVDFYWDETVTLLLDREIRDTSGHEMASDISFTFTIGQQPVVPTTASLSNVNISPNSNVVAYSPITVSGSFTYNTGAPVLAGTVTINTGDNTYTAAISNGAFSRMVDAPGSDRNVSITAVESAHGWTDTRSVYVTVEDPTGGAGYIFARSTTARDVNPSDPYDPVYETEYFRRSDDKACVWIELEHLEIPVRAMFKFYEPDGDLHYTYTSSWTDDPQAQGYDYWYWWKLWAWVNIDGYGASYEPGQWATDIFVDDGGGWDYKTTETFCIGLDFTEHRTARDVQSSDPYLPIGETNVFYTDEDKALTWANADDVCEAFDVRWQFYEPNGSLYNTFYYTTTDPGSDSYYDRYRFWGWIDIDGALAAQKPGDWHVDVALKEPNGSYDGIYTDYFQILERPAVAPTVSVTPSVSDPIETQSFSLTVAASDNTYLEDVTLYWHDGVLHTREWADLYSGSKSESVPIGPYGSGQQIQYWAIAVDTSGNTYESPRRTLVVQPETVSAPTPPSGPAACEPNASVALSTSGSTTSLGAAVEYQFDWGDGQLSSWGPANQSHAWASVASYPVRARARSQVRPARVSDWSEVGLVNVALNVPVGLNAVSVSSSEIDLSWTDISTHEDGFRIERRTVSGTWTEIDTVAADVSTFRDSGLADQTEYFYRVRAFSSAGNSLFSNEASATTGAADDDAPTADLADPAAGSSIPVTAINLDRRWIDVTFLDAGGSGLNGATITDAGSEFTLGGLAASGVTVEGAAILVAGTTYRYSFTGDFAVGLVDVSFIAASWADNAGNGNGAETESFDVTPWLGEIRGSKWNDENSNGVWDAGEPGLPGWTIYLDLNENGQLDATSVDALSSGNVPLAITDNTTITSELAIAGLGVEIADVDITLNITHTYDADLDVFLISPQGTRVELFTDVGSVGDDFQNTTLDDEAGTSIAAGTAPFAGTYRPEGILGSFDGEDPNGTWLLEIHDDAGADTGSLNGWSITITAAGEPATVTDANGDYAFLAVEPRTYRVAEIPQAGWTQTFPGSATYLLEATFDDKPIGLPIGTAGAVVGEPVSVSPSVLAVVRAEPMGTPSLELADNDDYSAGAARFEFLDRAELSEGTLLIDVDLHFEVLDGYDLYVREQGSSACSFLSMTFTKSGMVLYNDEDSAGTLGTYDLGRTMPLRLAYDLDNRTYDIWLDGQLVVDGETHGVTGRGIGSVLFGTEHDADYDGELNLDNLFVTHYSAGVPYHPVDLHAGDTISDLDFGNRQRHSPPPGIVDMTSGSDTGVSSSDGLTRLDNSGTDTRLSFVVSDAIPGATVTLYANGTEIGDTVAAATTAMIITNGTYDLVDGLHEITARQQESGRLISAESPALTITVDTEAPAAPSSLDLQSASDTGIPDDDITHLTTPTFDIIQSGGLQAEDGGMYPSTTSAPVLFVDAAGGPNGTQKLFCVEAIGDGGAPSGGSPQVIAGVPAYFWYRGCGPTAAGMALGYWDARGYPDLLTSSSDNMIATAAHYADYSLPLDDEGTGLLADKSELGGAHESNSIADFMHTSWSAEGNLYGWSWLSDVDDAFRDYSAYCGYADAQSWTENWGAFTWSDYTAEINAGRPMVLLVDTEGDGDSDHFVTGIGYDDASQQYACYDTWNTSVHWYDFDGISVGQPWGIYGAAYFVPGGAAEGTYFRVYRDGSRISSDYETGSAFTATGQTEGIWSFTASTVDAAGNESVQSAPLSVLIDATAPTADLAEPTNGSMVGATMLNGRGYIDVTFDDLGGSGLDLSTITDAGAEFTLSGAAASAVTVDGAAMLVTGTTYRYSFTGEFSTGHVTVDFQANAWQDLAGNGDSAASESFGVNEPPVVDSFSISDPVETTPGYTNQRELSVSMAESDADGTVVGWLITESATAPEPSSADWLGSRPLTYTIASPGEGLKVLYAWVKDDSGNVSELTPLSQAQIALDMTPPSAMVDRLDTDDTTPQLTGMVDDPDAAVEVAVAGSLYPALNRGDGTWVLPDDTITDALPRGIYDVSVTATDAAGNVGTDGTTNELMVCAPGPLVVTTLLDEDDGDYSQGDLSLREALAVAAVLPGDDTITFAVTGTVTLAAGLGQLVLDNNVDIQGPGASQLTIDAAGNSRVLYVDSGVTATIGGLTVTGGYATCDGTDYSDCGGGIHSRGTLLIAGGVTISGNSADADGGAIYNAGSLTVSDATICENAGPYGGGVSNWGTLSVADSAISRNSGGGVVNWGEAIISGAVVSDNPCNGIINLGGILTITNGSVVSGNTAGYEGGGVLNGATLAITGGSSISGNSAVFGGGICNWGTLSIGDAIVCNNTTTGEGAGIYNEGTVTGGGAVISENTASGSGGGIYNMGTVTVEGISILDNSASDGGGVHNEGTLTLAGGTIRGNMVAGRGAGVYNQGHLSMTGSLVEWNGSGTGAGIYSEGFLALTSSIIQDNFASDSGGGIYSSGRLAIDGTSIVADNHSGFFGGGIMNDGGEFTIIGATVSGNEAEFGGGIYNWGGQGTVSGTTVCGNWAYQAAGGGYGGGIANAEEGILSLIDSTISDNWVNGRGGGIYNRVGATLAVENSTIARNSAGDGGGIYNFASTLTILNSTISGNAARGGMPGYADGVGGGICNGGELSIVNATITNNRADASGYGAADGGGVSGGGTLHNTIVAGNYLGTATTPDDVAGGFDVASSHNLIGVGDGGNFVDGQNGNQVGTLASPLNPRLGALADNGGPTLTHALLADSPAIDGGDNDRASSAGLTLDQRGSGRFADSDGDGVCNVDIGSFEVPGPCFTGISGTVWHDLDGDGVRGEGEPGLEGWTVFLDLNNDGEWAAPGAPGTYFSGCIEPDDFPVGSPIVDPMGLAVLSEACYQTPVIAVADPRGLAGGGGTSEGHVFGYTDWYGEDKAVWNGWYTGLQVDFAVPVRTVSLEFGSSGSPGGDQGWLIALDTSGQYEEKLTGVLMDGDTETLTISRSSDEIIAIYAAGWWELPDSQGVLLDHLTFSGGDPGRPPEPAVVTGADGAYAFTDLPPETYGVTEVLEAGWVQASPADGRHSVVIPSGLEQDGKDIGNAALVYWSGMSDDHWENADNWLQGTLPGQRPAAVFEGSVTYQPALYEDEAVFCADFRTPEWTVGGDGFVLTVGSGGIGSAGSGTNTIAPNVALSDDSTWTIGDENTLVLNGGLNGEGQTLTKDGEGTLVLGGSENKVSTLVINGGTVRLANGAGPLVLNSLSFGDLLGGLGESTPAPSAAPAAVAAIDPPADPVLSAEVGVLAADAHTANIGLGPVGHADATNAMAAVEQPVDPLLSPEAAILVADGHVLGGTFGADRPADESVAIPIPVVGPAAAVPEAEVAPLNRIEPEVGAGTRPDTDLLVWEEGTSPDSSGALPHELDDDLVDVLELVGLEVPLGV